MAVLITPDVARQAAAILEKWHTAVAVAITGEDAVSPDAWKLAVDLGLVDPNDSRQGKLHDLYLFGAFLGHVEEAGQAKERYGTTVDEFLAAVAKHPVARTETEERAAAFVSRAAAQHIVGLGNRVGAKVGSTLIESDRALDRKLRRTVRDVVAARFGDDDALSRLKLAGIDKDLDDEFFDDEFRGTVQRMVSDIGHLTDDWSRDLHRIAQTEGHTAVSEGLKESWKAQEERAAKRQERAPDALKVYKIPRPGACKHCLRLHLDGDNPRIFILDDLETHGTNVGRKANDWRAVVGSTHPWCGCALVRLPRYIDMPRGWRPGEAAPTVVGSNGRLVIP